MDPEKDREHGRRPSWAEPGRDETVHNVETIDVVIARRVGERFLGDPAIHSGHVVIEVQNGVVIIEGRIDSDEARDAASHHAWGTAGVRDVSNRLITPHAGPATPRTGQ